MTNEELRYSVRKTNLECLTEKKREIKQICGSKCFSLRNTSRWCFFIFLKINLLLVYQNNLKT
jgi:hypothetical protein